MEINSFSHPLITFSLKLIFFNRFFMKWSLFYSFSLCPPHFSSARQKLHSGSSPPKKDQWPFFVNWKKIIVPAKRCITKYRKAKRNATLKFFRPRIGHSYKKEQNPTEERPCPSSFDLLGITTSQGITLFDGSASITSIIVWKFTYNVALL